MSIIQTNFIKRAIKDEKTTKRGKSPPKSWLPSPPLYSKSGGKTVNAASFKKALAMSQPIFKPKSPISSSQDRFLWRGEETDSTGASSGTFNGGEGIKTIRQPFYLPNMATADLFLFQRGEIEAGRPLTVPGRPHEKCGGGRLNQQQK